MKKALLVVITGASGGIGKMTAAKYLSESYQVIGLDSEPIRTVYPIVKCDISDESQIVGFAQYVREHFGAVQYLINCAGVFFCEGRYGIDHVPIDEWKRTLDINLTGTMMMTKHMLPLMRSASGDRAIVNLSSDQSAHPRERNAAYAVSKSGIDCLTRASARELRGDKIRVNAVAAASVRTDFIRRLALDEADRESIFCREDEKMPLGLIEPSDIAELCFFLGSPHSVRITGQTILVDSGLYL